MQLRTTTGGTAAALACASLLATCVARDRGRVGATLRQYSGRTAEVTTPEVEARVRTTESTAVRAHWKADVISAATPVMAAPDAVTRATTYTETRHEGSVGVDWTPQAETTVQTGYTLSAEPDTLVHTATASIDRDLLDRSATLSLGGRFSHFRVGATDRPAFERRLQVYGAQVGWTHVLNPALLLRGDYSLEVRDGYQANPYRYVPIWRPGGERPRFALRERLPRRRFRHAWSGLAVWSLSTEVFLRGGYRFYLDGWAVRSHTLRAALWWEHPDDWLRVRLRARAYRQSGAAMWQRRYTDVGGYRTGDPRLSPNTSVQGGLRIESSLSPFDRTEFRLSVGYDLGRRWLHEYAPYRTTTSHIGHLSLEAKLP